MRLSSIACASLCLTNICACCHAPVQPPQIVRVPEYMTLPVACQRLQPVDLPAGTTAQQLIERQHAALLAYEQQIRACASMH